MIIPTLIKACIRDKKFWAPIPMTVGLVCMEHTNARVFFRLCISKFWHSASFRFCIWCSIVGSLFAAVFFSSRGNAVILGKNFGNLGVSLYGAFIHRMATSDAFFLMLLLLCLILFFQMLLKNSRVKDATFSSRNWPLFQGCWVKLLCFKSFLQKHLFSSVLKSQIK